MEWNLPPNSLNTLALDSLPSAPIRRQGGGTQDVESSRMIFRRAASVVPEAKSPMDHLYLMQTTSGDLKIGRSGDPERRRRGLECAAGRKVVILRVLADRGDTEADAHQRLAPWRGLGEWFASTDQSRRAVQEIFGEVRFPYPIGGGKAGRKRKAEAEMDMAIAALVEKIRTTTPKRRRAVY